MRTVNAKCGSVIPLGRLGENEATVVVFDIAEWLNSFGDGGSFSLLNVRDGETAAYPCAVNRAGNEVRWEIKSADVANVGYGKCELIYTIDNTVAKSEVFTTVVGKALTGGGEVPEPWEDWVEMVLQAGADAQDAKYVWENMTAVGVESSEVFAEYENGVLTVGVPMGGGGGTYDHTRLDNLDAPNQHPISAVIGLQSALDGKQPIGDYATTQDVSDLADIVDTKADASDIPSLDGYATENYVNNHHDSTKQDVINDLATIRSGASKGATAYQKPANGIPASDLASGVIPSAPTALSQLSEDSTHRVVTDAEKTAWSAKQNAITDIDTIRIGAAKGATAVQPNELPDYPKTDQAQEVAIDTEPVENSTNLITSGAVFDAMQGGGGGASEMELIYENNVTDDTLVFEYDNLSKYKEFAIIMSSKYGNVASATMKVNYTEKGAFEYTRDATYSFYKVGVSNVDGLGSAYFKKLGGDAIYICLNDTENNPITPSVPGGSTPVSKVANVIVNSIKITFSAAPSNGKIFFYGRE